MEYCSFITADQGATFFFFFAYYSMEPIVYMLVLGGKAVRHNPMEYILCTPYGVRALYIRGGEYKIAGGRVSRPKKKNTYGVYGYSV